MLPFLINICKANCSEYSSVELYNTWPNLSFCFGSKPEYNSNCTTSLCPGNRNASMVCQSLLGKGKESYPTNVSALTLADALIDCRLTVNWSIARQRVSHFLTLLHTWCVGGGTLYITLTPHLLTGTLFGTSEITKVLTLSIINTLLL